MAKYIEFKKIVEGEKTNQYGVYSNTALGVIRWYGPWRSYAFFPVAKTLYEKVCLRDIADFIEEVNTEHRNALKAKKAKPEEKK